jgi:hypothetical protein
MHLLERLPTMQASGVKEEEGVTSEAEDKSSSESENSRETEALPTRELRLRKCLIHK